MEGQKLPRSFRIHARQQRHFFFFLFSIATRDVDPLDRLINILGLLL